MIRLIILASLVSIAALLFRKFFSQLKLNQPTSRTKTVSKPTEEKISKCETCGLHVPESSGQMHQDKFFCSEAHKLAFIETHSKETP